MTPLARPVLAPDRTRVGRDRFLLVAVVVSTLLRVPGLLATPSSDEAGFLLVARAWSPTPDSLYGPYWVDRSPVLIAAYRWSAALLGDAGPRVLAAVLCAVLVVCVHLLAARVAGRVPGRVATVVTVVLLADPALHAWTAKGEVLGVPFALLGCLLAVRALDTGSSRAAFLAGLCACLACGFKQNLAGGLVFVALLLVLSRTTPRRLVRLLGLAGLGAAVPVVACLAWVVLSPATIGAAWYQVVGFRADASAVLAASDSQAPVERAHALALLFVVSGMAPLLVLALASVRRWWARWPALSVALLAMTVVDLAGVVLGGSYWTTYLVPLIPDVALLAALAVGSGPPVRTLTRFVAGLAVVATLASYAGFVEGRLVSPTPTGPYQVGEAIGAVAGRDDTIVSLYGRAELVAASGLPSPYRHLWSLPMRTMDPDHDELLALLDSPAPPTWVVAVLPLDSWDIDAGGRLQRTLVQRYRLVSISCGPMVWLRRDVVRRPPPVDCTDRAA